jgi:hypothetical protein
MVGFGRIDRSLGPDAELLPDRRELPRRRDEVVEPADDLLLDEQRLDVRRLSCAGSTLIATAGIVCRSSPIP